MYVHTSSVCAYISVDADNSIRLCQGRAAFAQCSSANPDCESGYDAINYLPTAALMDIDDNGDAAIYYALD